MKTKGNQVKIQQIIHNHGIFIESQTTKGNFTSYRLKRKEKALRIIPAGDNYYFDGVYKDGKRWRYTFQNVHYTRYVIDKPLPLTTIMGNAAWYGLISELLETGAAERIDVLGQRFESVEQYQNYVQDCVLWDLVEAEREANKGE